MNEHSELNLTEVFGAVSKNKSTFLSLFLAVMFTTIVVTLLVPPVYKASSKLIIQNENNMYPQGLVPTTSEDSVFLRTQKEIITSSIIVSQALKDVHAQGLLKKLDYEYIKKKVFAEYLSDSNVLDVQVFLQEPTESIELANMITATFLNYHKKSKSGLLDQNIDAVAKEAARIKKDIDGLSTRLRDLKDKDQLVFYQAQVPYYVNNILELYKHNQLTETDISRLKGELVKIKNAMTSDQREFFYPVLANPSGENVNTTPTASLATIPWMDDVKKKLTDAQSKLSQLSATYTQDYPEVIGVESQIASLKSSMDRELQKVLKAHNEYYTSTINFLETQQKSGESEKTRNVAEMDNLLKKIDNASMAQIEFTVLTKFHDIYENIYSVFLRKQSDLELLRQQLKNSDLPNIRVLELAALPLKRTSPIWPLNMVLGACFGLILGICASLSDEQKETIKTKAVSGFSSFAEQRSMRRVDKNSVVTYEPVDKTDKVKRYTTSANISPFGVCLRLKDKLDVNSKLPLEIQTSGKDSIKATGKIVWRRSAAAQGTFDAGVSFEEIDSQEREKLINFLYGRQTKVFNG